MFTYIYSSHIYSSNFEGVTLCESLCRPEYVAARYTGSYRYILNNHGPPRFL